MEKTKPVPIIKWIGGKRQLLAEIEKRMPKTFGTYFEPFVGGGALFFDLCPEHAVLNDYNSELANLYRQVQQNCQEIQNMLSAFQDQYNGLPDMQKKDAYYYAKRDEFNACLSQAEHSIQSAALLVFLNKSGFNGLYRINQRGLYNVPLAHRQHLNLYAEQNLTAASLTLKNAAILTGDFEDACLPAKKGDFVFFDSPYYDTFDTYQAGGFSAEDHERLYRLFCKLTEAGVYCIATNNNCEFIKNLYRDFYIDVIPVKRMVNSDASHRTGEEVIISNYKESK